jgi:hypothetical protein
VAQNNIIKLTRYSAGPGVVQPVYVFLDKVLFFIPTLLHGSTWGTEFRLVQADAYAVTERVTETVDEIKDRIKVLDCGIYFIEDVHPEVNPL